MYTSKCARGHNQLRIIVYNDRVEFDHRNCLMRCIQHTLHFNRQINMDNLITSVRQSYYSNHNKNIIKHYKIWAVMHFSNEMHINAVNRLKVLRNNNSMYICPRLCPNQFSLAIVAMKSHLIDM